MTNEHNIGGTSLVNTTTTATSNSNELKHHSMRKKSMTEHLEEVALMKEEEKLIDEEITSIESSALDHYDGVIEEEDDNEKVEQAMMSVAIMQSVRDVGPRSTGRGRPPKAKLASSSSTKDIESLKREGLRKRRRPSGNDTNQIEPLAVLSTKTTTNRTIKPKSNEGSSSLLIPTSRSSNINKNNNKTKRSTKQQQQQLNQTVEQRHPGDEYHLYCPPPNNSMTNTPPVPNPLCITNTLPPPLLPNSIDTLNNSTNTIAPLNVPCPLSFMNDFEYNSTTNDFPSIEQQNNQDTNDNKLRVTFCEDNGGSRDRAFSIDLDLFAEEQSISESNDLNCLSGSNRRDRAFSFECFAFGINSDEPLPPLDQSTSLSSYTYARPRGDSIIFDPSSFQEGGIHEQTALERTTDNNHVDRLVDNVLHGVPSNNNISSFIPAPDSIQSMITKPNNTLSTIMKPKDTISNSVQSSSAEITNGTTSTTSLSTSTCGNNNTSTIIPYDILNKDGRIGIYLPDARRDRIARFHSKRSKRIWRKRIKYDCRKKLADSRPRIKGRFVKRSDIDED